MFRFAVPGSRALYLCPPQWLGDSDQPLVAGRPAYVYPQCATRCVRTQHDRGIHDRSLLARRHRTGVRTERRCRVGNFAFRLAKAHVEISSPPRARFCGRGSTTMVGDGCAPRQPADTTIAIGVHTVMSASTSGRHVAVADKRSNALMLLRSGRACTTGAMQPVVAINAALRWRSPGGIALRGVSFDTSTQRRRREVGRYRRRRRAGAEPM